MATDNETTPRRRGRPKKVVEDHQTEVEQIAPHGSIAGDADWTSQDDLEDENAAMRAQVAYQMQALFKMAQKLGIDPLEGFERPPKDTTVVVESEQPAVQAQGKPKPGSVVGDPRDRNSTWIPWRKEDLDPNDTISFVPQPIPALVFPLEDEDGHQKIRLDVNDLVCWLTVGVPNTVNKIFYHAYMDAYNTWKELESFKRNGPQIAPWGVRGPDGRPAWSYIPQALSFGLDLDGHFITPFRQGPLAPVSGEPEAI